MQPAPPIDQRPDTLTEGAAIDRDSRQQFLSLSAALTGFSHAELSATGMADVYYDTFASLLGEAMLGCQLIAWAKIAQFQPQVRDQAIAGRMMTDATVGPMARNLITLWYLGQWTQMPAEWRGANGAHANDMDQIASADAYVESLVWKAMRGHPQGAKQPGFGSWALEPAQGDRHADA